MGESLEYPTMRWPQKGARRVEWEVEATPRALTWPAEPAEVVGVATHRGPVSGGGKAVAAAQGFQLHCVLQVWPAEKATEQQLRWRGLAAQTEVDARHQHAAARHAASGLHSLQQCVQRTLLEPLEQRVRDCLELLLQKQQPRAGFATPRPAALLRLRGLPGLGIARVPGRACSVPLGEETASHRLAVTLRQPARASRLHHIQRGAPSSGPRLRHGPRGAPRAPAPARDQGASRSHRVPEPPRGYRADFGAAATSALSCPRGRLSSAAQAPILVATTAAAAAFLPIRDHTTSPKSPHQPRAFRPEHTIPFGAWGGGRGGGLRLPGVRSLNEAPVARAAAPHEALPRGAVQTAHSLSSKGHRRAAT